MARSFIGTGAIQKINNFGVNLPIVKHSYVVRDSSQIRRIGVESFHISKNGRLGPVLIVVARTVGLADFAHLFSSHNNVGLSEISSSKYL